MTPVGPRRSRHHLEGFNLDAIRWLSRLAHSLDLMQSPKLLHHIGSSSIEVQSQILKLLGSVHVASEREPARGWKV
jgi:hypothetical protein